MRLKLLLKACPNKLLLMAHLSAVAFDKGHCAVISLAAVIQARVWGLKSCNRCRREISTDAGEFKVLLCFFQSCVILDNL